MARKSDIRLRRSATAGAAPTTSQLNLGELAINTYDGKLYLKKDVSGTESIVEIGASTDSQEAVWKEYVYTATSNQTSFSGSDDNSNTLSYTPLFLQVYLNGVLLDNGTDYTATNGTAVVLVNGASAGDLLQVASFVKVIGNGDTVVNTFTGDGSTAAYTLTANPDTEDNTTVFVDGVYQEKDTYAVSGTTLTFDANVPNGASIEVLIGSKNVTLSDIADLSMSGDLTVDTDTLFVDASQNNVGIGLNTPIAAADLHIKTSVDDSVTQGLVIERSANTDRGYINYQGGAFQIRSTVGDPINLGETDAVHMRINPDGNVGIGTTSPDAPLKVQATAASSIPALGAASSHSAIGAGGFGTMFGTLTSGRGYIQQQRFDGTATGYDLLLQPNGGNVGIGTGSAASRLHIVAGTNALRTITIGDSAGNNSEIMGAVSSGNPRLAFKTAGVEAMRIDESQNIGIGTTSPNRILEIEASVPAVRLTDTSTSGMYHEILGDGNSLSIEADDGNVGASSSINFKVDGSERVRIDSSGNVGIGTTSPSVKLQIEEYGIDTTETSTTATTQVAIHTLAAATFRSARFTVQVTNSTDSTYHLTEILMIHDGTTPSITEYGTIFTGSAEATFDADISSGNVRLLATPATTDSMEFKVICHSITV